MMRLGAFRSVSVKCILGIPAYRRDRATSRVRLKITVVVVLLACCLGTTAWGQSPLRVHPDNPRYFTNGSGRAIWLTGSHTWATFQERGVAGETPDFDYDAWLDFMARNGHNFLRLWRWEHAQWMQFVPAETLIRYEPMAYERTGPGTALDGKPKLDLSKFNQTYFDRLRDRLVKAQKRGIYVSVMMFQGFSVEQKGTRGVDPKKGNAWMGHPFNKANNINGVDGDANGDNEGDETHTLKSPAITRLQEAYVRKVIDTLKDLDNVLWEISNESHTGSINWHKHMIRFIKDCEANKPAQHPVGMTSSPISNPPLFASGAEWISPNTKAYLNDPPPATGEKVIIVDTDHIAPWDSHPDWVWKNLLRGNHFILMDHYRDFRIGSPAEPDAKHNPTRRTMGLARKVAARVDLAKMTPQGELASTGYCLADRGSEYLVFRPAGEKAGIRVKLEAGAYSVSWFDTRTGRWTTRDDVKTDGGDVRLSSPMEGRTLAHIKR